jgi:hypothetical protein
VLLSTSRASPEFLEGFIAIFAAVMVVVMLPVWPGIRSTLARQSRRYMAIYFTVLIALVLLIALLIYDIFTPNHPFRDGMVITALTLAVVGMPIWFVTSLRSNSSGVRDYEFRGLSGRALPSVIASVWFACLAVWIIKVFPNADSRLVLAAIFGFIAFFVLAFVTNIFRHPKFLIPIVMRGRSHVPDLITVIVDRADSGWHAWSTDLEDLERDANTLEEIDRSVRADLHRRFARPGQHTELRLQFLVEEKSPAPANLPPTDGMPKEQLFEAKRRSGGGYTAQSVDKAGLELRADNLDDLLMKVEASGSQTVRLTWSHELTI